MGKIEDPWDPPDSFGQVFGEFDSEAPETPPRPPIEPPFMLRDDSCLPDRETAFVAALEKLALPLSENEASLNEESIDKFISFFVTLYGKGIGYRHNYSDVCSIMYRSLKADGELDQKELPFEAVALDSNVNLIVTAMKDKKRERVQQESQCKNYDHVVKSLRKLYDHIQLEMIRLSYLITQNRHLVEAAHNAQNASKKAQHAFEETRGVDKNLQTVAADITNSLNEAKQEYREMADRSKRDYITILGIFAAIILTFTSGFAFSASVLQNIATVNIYKLLFVAIAVGCFLSNLVAALLAFIGRISGLLANMTVKKILLVIFLPINGLSLLALIAVYILHFFPNYFG